MINDCGRKAVGHGLCMKHYQAERYSSVMKPYHAKRYEERREQILSANEKWRMANQQKVEALRVAYAAVSNKKAAVWSKAHPERRKETQSSWVKRHPDRVNAQTARRRAKQLKATPRWENTFFISEIYDLANRRTRMTGVKWEVDHIVPLRSSIVCGLHVETNLRVIPKVVNASKSNRYWPDMPEVR